MVSALSACSLLNPPGTCWQSERIRPGTTLDWGLLVGSHFCGAAERAPGAHAGLAGVLGGAEGVVGTDGVDVAGEGNGVVGEGDCGTRVPGVVVLPGDGEGGGNGEVLGAADDDVGGGLVVGSAIPDCAPAMSSSTAAPATLARNIIRCLTPRRRDSEIDERVILLPPSYLIASP
ncbi:hypothetical protein AB0M22_22780 [Nocardia sp. NPDC051756]|uniref:hypothetical protein n=1 Tax=Nocardia sp. NPDC051756 TaxID=3154751 RepID=UPI003419638F